jgi:pimeloyl-ACP methyl ester carboxylesterase
LLHAHGFAVLLFDFQAHGESPGRRITFGHLEAMDAAAALDFLEQRLPRERVGAIGASLGGAAAVLADPPLRVDALVPLTNRLRAAAAGPRACRSGIRNPQICWAASKYSIIYLMRIR